MRINPEPEKLETADALIKAEQDRKTLTALDAATAKLEEMGQTDLAKQCRDMAGIKPKQQKVQPVDIGQGMMFIGLGTQGNTRGNYIYEVSGSDPIKRFAIDPADKDLLVHCCNHSAELEQNDDYKNARNSLKGKSQHTTNMIKKVEDVVESLTGGNDGDSNN